MSSIFSAIDLQISYPKTHFDVKNTYVADVSGIDSIAAIVKILSNDPKAIILPSIVDLACEFGEKEDQYRNAINNLRDVFNSKKERVLNCIVLDVNELWKSIVVSEMQTVIKNYGFYSPCIACHFVFHISRILLAKKIGVDKVISGERTLHNNKEKINQLDFVLDFFNSLYNREKIIHFQPIRNVKSTKELTDTISSYKLQPVRLKCLFSKNYYKKNTSDLDLNKDSIRNYLENWLSILVDNYQESVTIKSRLLSLHGEKPQ